jgi:hypothetical protein
MPVAVAHARYRTLLLPLLLALLTLATFARLLGADFTNFDDGFTVARNPNLNPPTWPALARNWTRTDMDIYMPLTRTAWSAIAAGAQLQQPDPSGIRLNPYPFHAANLLLHLASVLLVYSILQQLGMPLLPAAAGAAVFAVQPVQVEAVAWVSGLKDVLCGALSLAALRIWMAPITTPDRPRLRQAAAATIFALALLAKPSAVAVPAVAALIARIVLGQRWRTIGWRILPWVALALPIAILGAAIQPARYVVHQPLRDRVLLVADSLNFYLHKLIWPWPLAVDYGHTPQSVLANGRAVLTGELLLCLAILGALWLLRHRWPTAVAGAAVFLAAIAPVSGIVPFDYQQFSTVADHYLYLPMLGVAMIVAATLRAASRCPPARMPAWSITAAAVAAMAIISARQCEFWNNATSLMSHATAVNPRSWMAYLNLADAESDTNPAQAQSDVRRALGLQPGSAAAWNTLGSLQMAAGQRAAAIQSFHRAHLIAPDVPLLAQNEARARAQK